MPPVLLPIYLHPLVDPAAWQAVAADAGVTVVVDGMDGDPAFAAAVRNLSAAGVAVIGRVDTGFATRPVADLLDDVARWARLPVQGILLDQAPSDPFSLGAVALAVRVARRAGFARVVLNPGIPTDPLYRQLGTPMCTFYGPWWEYLRWSGEGARRGDGHLVHSVPPAEFANAWSLLEQREAGFGLVTDRTPPEVFDGLPRWLHDRARAGDAVGSAGTSTTTGC